MHTRHDYNSYVNISRKCLLLISSMYRIVLKLFLFHPRAISLYITCQGCLLIRRQHNFVPDSVEGWIKKFFITWIAQTRTKESKNRTRSYSLTYQDFPCWEVSTNFWLWVKLLSIALLMVDMKVKPKPLAFLQRAGRTKRKKSGKIFWDGMKF